MIYGEKSADWLKRVNSWQIKFAWFPVSLSDGRSVWLEKYRVREWFDPDKPGLYGMGRWRKEVRPIE